MNSRYIPSGKDRRHSHLRELSQEESAALKLSAAIRPCLESLERRQLLNGAIDTTFGTGGKAITDFGSQDIGDGMAVLSNGKFIVVGESNGEFAVAKYNADGSPDTSFGGGTGRLTTAIGSAAHATSVVIDGSGRIVVGGYALIGATFDFALARYSSTGVLDGGFGAGGIVTTDFAARNDRVFSLTIQPTGEIVAVGTVFTGPAAVNQDFGLARYSAATGALDATFGTGGKVTTDLGAGDQAYAVAYDASLSKLVVAGGSGGAFALARYNLTGTLDTSFDGDGVALMLFPGSASALALGIDSSGRYVAAGVSGSDFAVGRYLATGAPDLAFDSDGQTTFDFNAGFDQANGIALQADGKILVAGVASMGGSGDFALARLTTGGALDTTFGLGTGKIMTDVQGISDSGAAVAIQPTTNKILVAGTSNGGASQDDFAIVRYESVQHDAWVDDNWNVTVDVGAPGLSFGDTVQNTGAGDTGALVTKTFGFDAFDTIVAALNSVAGGPGDAVHIEAGTYLESDISITKQVIIDGFAASRDQVVVAPALASAHPVGPGQIFASGVHNAFVIRNGNITISDLTIDGDAGFGGGGSKNYFGGIVYDYNLGTAFNNLTASNLRVQNLFRVGIYFDGGINAESSGHLVADNTVQNVIGGSQATGILMLQASGTVRDNTILETETGIGTNYIDGTAYAPNLIIRGNNISDVGAAMDLSGLDAGSLIGGPTLAERNTIDLTVGAGLNDVGIVVQYAGGVITVQNNLIIASDGDSGVWLYHNASGQAPLITGNTITASSSDGTNAGEGTGIFVTDDGSFFTETTGAESHATLTGNTITGFARGVDLYRNEDNPIGGFAVAVTINGNNDISGNSTGIRVFDANGTTAANATAIISGNSASISGNTVGIDVDGGTATISNNHIFDNGIGVRVRNGGTASLDMNNFDGGVDNATDLQLINSPGTVTVGSSNPNDFAGDTFYIDDQSTQNLDASNNNFDVGNNFSIERRMHHRVDTDLLVTNGLISWVAGNIYITASGTDHSIQRGVDAASAGNTIFLETGTFDEATTVNKAVTISGAGQTPVVTRTTGASNQKLFSIASTNVTLTGLTMHVNRPFAVAGVYGDTGVTGNFNGLAVTNNTIRSLGSGGLLTGALGGPTSAAGIALLGTSAQFVTLSGNDVKADNDITPTSVFGRGIWLGGIRADVLNNPTVAGLAQDLLLSAMASGTTTVMGNTFFGAGVDISSSNVGTIINVDTNTFTPASPLFPQSMIVKANVDGTVNITNNMFSGHNNTGLLVGASKNVLVKDNSFTPDASSSNYSHFVFSTGYPTNSGFINVPNQSATVQGNTFNGAAGASGRAMDFQNVNSAVGNGVSSITLGGAGALANKFNASLTEFMRLTPTFMAPHPPAGTTAYTPAPFNVDLDVQNNQFDVGAGLQLPAAMAPAGLFTMENKIYHKVDNAAVGLVTFIGGNVIFVSPATSPTPTDNDYTRIANAIAAASDGFTINLSGNFDWTETNAAASWTLGNDATASTADDYQCVVPAGLDNVIFTAPGGLGTASILGPGDLVGSAGGFLTFRGGPNLGWTISNLTIQNFEIGIGMFFGAPGVHLFDNTLITNNHIVVATDLNPAVAGADDIYAGNDVNVGIHYSFGDNQTISNNVIDFAGTGVSDSGGGNFAASIGVLSNTSGGAYEGLNITGNIMHVTGAQSGDPEVVRGIWENGHAHGKNINVSSNQFLNQSPGNDPALNLQRAFTVTSHSDPTGTVTYDGNIVQGANLGWQWLGGQNFSGHLPVRITNNTLTNVATGLLIRSNGSAILSGNSLTNSGAMLNVGTGVSVDAGSSATIDDSVAENSIVGFATGIRAAGTVIVSGNDASIHGNAIGIDVDGGNATITGNHIYNNTTGVRVRNSGTATLDDNNFDGGGNPDNLTDLLLNSSPGAVTLGGSTANNFAGDTFFIDNQSTQNLNAINSFFDVFTNFDIEDLMHHRVDTDLAIGNGLITWVANNLYITDAGTDHSIQRGHDAAPTAGYNVNVEAGSYTESVVVTKVLNFLGAKAGVDARGRVVGVPNPAVESVWSPATASSRTVDYSTGSGATVVDGFAFLGGASLGAAGVIHTSVGPNNNMQVLNNYISAPAGAAIFINRSGADVTIDKNVFDGANMAGSGQLLFMDGPDAHHGIFITNNIFRDTSNRAGVFVDGDHNVSESATRAPLISGNLFTNLNVGMNLGSRSFGSLGAPALGAYAGTISLNTFSSNQFDGVQGGPQHVLITRNTFSGNGRTGLALTSFGNMTAGRGAQFSDVTNNFFSGNVQEDVLFSATQPVNTIKTNRVRFNSMLSTRAMTYNGTETPIDAGYNWYGNQSGPSGGGHAGTGSMLNGTGAANLDVNPWLCVGTDVGGDPTNGFDPDLSMLCVDGLAISGSANVNEGALYTLSRTNSGDPDFGTITSWDINWGDGPAQNFPGASGNVTHTYADGPNNYVISATATNGVDTFTIIQNVSVTVNNVAPTIGLTGNNSVNEGSVYSLTLGAIVDPGTDTVSSYRVNWGDSFFDIFTAVDIANMGGVVTHTYADDNPTGTPSDSYTITVDLQDEDSSPGYFNSAGSKMITVNNVDPAPSINGAPMNSPEGTPISLTSSIIDPGADSFTYAWSVTKNGNPYDSGTNPNFTFTPNDNATYVVSLQVTDDDTGVGNAMQKTIMVTDVAPTIAVSGNATVNEGSVYTLNLGAITDPGMDTVTRYIIQWGDGAFDDIMANPAGTMHTHTYTDGTIVRNISISLFDEDGMPHANTQNPNPFQVTVQNVAPTATIFNGGAVNEGSNGVVGFAGQFDPSPQDVLAGFVYSYDFNNDGDFSDSGEFSDVVNASVGVPVIYLADGPGMRTVRARIKDKDGGFNDYTTTITINNVTPFVNGGPDINVPASVNFTQMGTFADPGADSPWVGKVDYEWNPGDLITDGDVQNLPLTGFNFTLSHTYTTAGPYVIRVYVTDKDGATGFDDVNVNVGPVPSFQVLQFLTNASGFTLRFNRSPDLNVLNLYDGIDGVMPSNDPADITVVGNSVGAVRGSLVWNPATNVLTFVRTNGVMQPDTYTLTVRSANDALKDTFGALLDGNADSTPGDNFSTVFNVANLGTRTLSMPDFARGPDSSSNINVPNTGSAGIPVRIDDGTQVRSVDFTINYDASLLNITGAVLAAGLPGDWSITSNLTTPGTAIITVFGTSTDLTAGPHDLVKLIANVPNTAPYTAAQAMRITNITVSRNDATTITTRGDSAIHKVVYFGDASGNRAYTGSDATLISRVVVALDSGFHAMRMVDPIIIADSDSSGGLTGIDASFVAQKAALLPRPEIPDLPGVLPPLVMGGIDPLISGGLEIPGRPGGPANFPVNIDDATNTYGFNVVLDYNTSFLDVADDVSGFSPDVALGSLYAGAGGWSLVSNVDDASGRIVLVFWRSSGVPMPGGTGPIANVNFQVSNSAVHNQSIPVLVSGPMSDQGLMFTHLDGNIRVDAVAPTVVQDTYHYQTSPHTISFKFSEDVSGSLSNTDLTVFNVTTSTTLPQSQFTLSSYDSLNNVATFTYTGGAFLPNGDYTATLTAAGVTDPAGNPLSADYVADFFFLMGDANHDRQVNLTDFNILAANFGFSPRDFTQGDFNYDGMINLTDFNILAGQFGAFLGPDSAVGAPTGGAPKLPKSVLSRINGGTTAPPAAGDSQPMSLGKIEGSLPIPTAAPSPIAPNTSSPSTLRTSPWSTLAVTSKAEATDPAPLDSLLAPLNAPFANDLIGGDSIV